MSRDSNHAPVIVYVINSFDRGGAEAGLVALVRGGLFTGFRLEIVSLVKGSGGLESELLALGQPVHILEPSLRMRMGGMPRLYARLRHFLRDIEPDAVIASLPQANILARLCLLFRRKPIFISFEHNTHLSKRFYESAYRLTSKRVDWIFADSQATLDIVVKRLYRRAPQTRWIVPLLSFQDRTCRPRRSDSDGTFHVVSAARFTPVKNQATLIKAMADLVRDGRNVTMTLYGEGPEREACQELAQRLGVLARVEFPGYIADWTGRPADLFVLASRHEGLCMVVLEAMHAGVPVAAAVVGGMADYADSSVLRQLDSDAPNAVSNVIAEAMDDRAGLAAQAERAAAMVENRFGAAAVARSLQRINEALTAATRERCHIPL
jgi:glycosyltransferase involved in cell wall biosynthesis